MMLSDPAPVIDQIKQLDKAALLRVKYAIMTALRDALPKGVVARHKIRGTESLPDRYVELMRTRCGRKTCPQCSTAQGMGHGPYWYLFVYEEAPEGGRRKRKSKYIGKELPAELLAQIGAAKAEKALEDPVRVEHPVKVGGSKVGHRAFRKVARTLATTPP